MDAKFAGIERRGVPSNADMKPARDFLSTLRSRSESMGGELLKVLASPSGNLFAALRDQPPFHVPSTTAADLTLISVIGGSGNCVRKGEGETSQVHLRPGSTTICPTDGSFEWEWDFSITSLEIYIAPSILRRYSEEVLDSASVPRFHSMHGGNDAWISGFMQLVLQEARQDDSNRTELDSLLLQQIEDVLVRRLVERHSDAASAQRSNLRRVDRAGGLRPSTKRKIVDFVESYLSRDISLCDLATMAFMSPSHFRRSFRIAFGVSPYKYVVSRRLASAMHLLRTTELSIAEIAGLCGFRSPPYFATVFRTRFGAAPTEFRRRSRDRAE
jgi:AraC-like DNA-binding protein